MTNIELDLKDFYENLQFRDTPEGKQIFDIVRKKWLILTPEETVRQSLMQYLIHDLGYSPKRLAVEKQIPFFDSYKRFDILYFNSQSKAVLLVECKSFKQQITQKVLDQISVYNQHLKVPLFTCEQWHKRFLSSLGF